MNKKYLNLIFSIAFLKQPMNESIQKNINRPYSFNNTIFLWLNKTILLFLGTTGHFIFLLFKNNS
jgi:hypothetical protein